MSQEHSTKTARRLLQLTPDQIVHFLQKLADMAARTDQTLKNDPDNHQVDLETYLRVQQRAFDQRFFRLGR